MINKGNYITTEHGNHTTTGNGKYIATKTKIIQLRNSGNYIATKKNTEVIQLRRKTEIRQPRNKRNLYSYEKTETIQLEKMKSYTLKRNSIAKEDGHYIDEENGNYIAEQMEII